MVRQFSPVQQQSKPMQILLLEDDHLEAQEIISELRRSLNAEVRHCKTEQQFRKDLDGLIASPPDALILDVMVRWCDPSPGMERPPADVIEHGIYRAGLRCLNLYRDKNQQTPAILYTVLEDTDLEEEVRSAGAAVIHLSKTGEEERLISTLQKMLESR